MREMEFNDVIKEALARVRYAYMHNKELTQEYLNGALYARDTFIHKTEDGLPSASDRGEVYLMFQRGEISESFLIGVRDFQERVYEVNCEIRGEKCGSAHVYN